MIIPILISALLPQPALPLAGTHKNAFEPPVIQIAQDGHGPFALVEFRGLEHTLTLNSSCGSGPESGGGYNTWASTLDGESLPIPDAPRLHVFSSGTWSRIEFYLSDAPAEVNLYHDGDEMVTFLDGEFSYEGPVSEGSGDSIRVTISCPK